MESASAPLFGNSGPTTRDLLGSTWRGHGRMCSRICFTCLVQLLIAMNLCTPDRVVTTTRQFHSTVIFAQTCGRVHQLHAVLKNLGLAAFSLHSKLARHQRLVALEDFQQTRAGVLVCTDVRSRVKNVSRCCKNGLHT